MTDFKYFDIKRTYNELYYQFPKVFIHGDTYSKLSHSAKLAYVLLKAELEFAIHKKQFDENGHVYFEFTVKELCKKLNCSNKTVIKIKKELSEYNLLKEIHMGFDPKKKKNNKNRLYLSELNVTESDVYSIIDYENENETRSVENTPRKIENTPRENLDNTGSVKSTPRENLDNTGSVKSTLIFNNHLDTLQDTLLDTGNNSIDLENYAKQIESEIDKSQTNSIPEPAKQTLLTFSANNYKIVDDQIGMIYRAKKEVATKYNVLLLIENDEWGFINAIKTISLAIYKDKKSIHKIKNYDNYFYMSIKKYFEQQAERINFKQEIENEELPPIPMTNWLEN